MAGRWLAETLAALRHPDRLSRADSGRSLQGTLRPYQPKQTRMVKQLRAETRFALTGTPIQKWLGDLWSIFDFINPGLLGSLSMGAYHVS